MDMENEMSKEEVFSKLLMLKKALKYVALMAPMVGAAGYFSHIDNLLNLVMMSSAGMGALTCAYNFVKFKAKGTKFEKLIP